MNEPWGDDVVFIDAAAGPDFDMCLAMSDEDHTRTRIPYTRLAFLIDGQWRHGGDLNWDVLAVERCASPLSQYAIVGVFGDCRFVGSGDVHDEAITDGVHRPEDNGLLRGLRSIDGRLFACGMNRQVYRRGGASDWKLIFDVQVTAEKVVGFEAIDGFGLDEIYVVGWEGEVWQFDGRLWHRRDSGTNLVLVDVCCAGDGQVYILANGRKLIIGRESEWKAHDLDLPVDLWRLAWFEDELYACSLRDAFVFRGGSFVPLPPADQRPATFQSLKLGHGRLMSIGPKDLCEFDAKGWTRIAR